MNAFDDALREIYARIPLGMRLGLEPMRAACAAAGHPERDVAIVHVAGTNGKGSVCAMVESIARARGMRTGLYTSPHLCRFAERIQIDGRPVDDDALAGWLRRALAADPPLSFFETATLAAFLAFRDARVDLAVIEVGLGGRLDATNVVPLPRAAAITRIALDHTDRLGPTLVDIAREKAGIAKRGLDLVLGPIADEPRAAIVEVARAAGATTSDLTGVPFPARVGLAGAHQADNARIAAVLGARIGASPEEIAAGVAAVRWPGRAEPIGPFLLDAAHNPDGAEAFARVVREIAPARGPVGLLFGALADKDWRATLDVLAPLAARRVYVAPRSAARSAVDPAELSARHPGETATDAADALRRFAGAPGALPTPLVLVTGSIALVGDARALLLNLPRDPAVAL